MLTTQSISSTSSIHPSIHPSIYPSIYQSIHLRIYRIYHFSFSPQSSVSLSLLCNNPVACPIIHSTTWIFPIYCVIPLFSRILFVSSSASILIAGTWVFVSRFNLARVAAGLHCSGDLRSIAEFQSSKLVTLAANLLSPIALCTGHRYVSILIMPLLNGSRKEHTRMAIH